MLSISFDATLKLLCPKSSTGEWDKDHFLPGAVPVLLCECCFTLFQWNTFSMEPVQMVSGKRVPGWSAFQHRQQNILKLSQMLD